MISRKIKEQVFTLDDGKDIDFESLEVQFSDLTIQLDKDKKEDKHIKDINKRYMNDEEQL